MRVDLGRIIKQVMENVIIYTCTSKIALYVIFNFRMQLIEILKMFKVYIVQVIINNMLENKWKIFKICIFNFQCLNSP